MVATRLKRMSFYRLTVSFLVSCKEKMNKLYVSSYGTIDTEGTGLLQVRTEPRAHGPQLTEH